MTELLPFLREVEGLKSVTRSAWTAAGRSESTAEHTWRLALFVALAAGAFPDVDPAKAVKMALIHDLGERYTGDVSAATMPDQGAKYEEELQAVKKLFALLPALLGDELLDLWQAYNACETPEARLVKALDKAETILQHNQGRNHPDFDYGFNLKYGAAYFQGDPELAELRRALDQETQSRIGE